MGFIVIEGIDGSGKSTQIRLLEEYFKGERTKTRFIHFPRTDTPVWGELISRFLRGELGQNNIVNPYLIALIYAGDRKDAAGQLLQWIADGYVVIADRYLYSNIAFQCAKIANASEKDRLARWIKYLEYEYYKIPVPDLNLFLDVPIQFTRKKLGEYRLGNDRDYLNGNVDIHEADFSFQEQVREMYLWQVRDNKDFEIVNCSDTKNNMLSPVEISGIVRKKIEHKLSKL